MARQGSLMEREGKGSEGRAEDGSGREGNEAGGLRGARRPMGRNRSRQEAPRCRHRARGAGGLLRAGLERRAGALSGGGCRGAAAGSALAEGQGAAGPRGGAGGERRMVPCSAASSAGRGGVDGANPPGQPLPLMPFLCCCAAFPATVIHLPLSSAGKRLIPFRDLPGLPSAGEAAAEVGAVGPGRGSCCCPAGPRLPQDVR